MVRQLRFCARANPFAESSARRAIASVIPRAMSAGSLGSTSTAALPAVSSVAVPTLVTYDKLFSEGASLGFPPTSVAKIDNVRLKGLDSLAIMRAAGLTMAYGTDLLGAMHRHQSEEFVIRGRVLPAREVIASATHIAARLCRMEGRIGAVAPGAYADLIAVDGNPLADLSLLTGQGRHMPLILRGGAVVKRRGLN